MVGISSIAALIGSAQAPAYAASKAFVSSYLDGLRAVARAKAPAVKVTEVAPGFVAAAMMKAERPFWVASPERTAEAILKVVAHKAKHAYVARRWAIIGFILHRLPQPG